MTSTAQYNGRQTDLRIPPHDEVAEESLLAVLLTDPASVDEAACRIGVQDFHGDASRWIFDAILTLRETHVDGPRIDLVAEHLERTGRLEDVGGYDRLMYLVRDAFGLPAHVDHYCSRIVDAARRRDAIRKAGEFINRAYEPGTPTEDLEDFAAELLKPKAAATRFEFHTAAHFDSLSLQRNYHIPGVLAAGPIPSGIFGAFKTLKTSIAMDLLLSLATQNPFLGEFQIPRRVRVAAMSGESGGFALQNLARRIASSKGWTFSGIGDWFRICTAVPTLSSKSDLAALERFVTSNEIQVLAIDPTYLAMRSLRTDEAASLFSMGDQLEPLSRLGERTGCTPLIVHHCRKKQADPNEPAELSDIAWSGFAEWCGQWILLSRREKYQADSDGEHKLWLNAGGRDGHSTLVGVDITEGRADGDEGRRWEPLVLKATSARASAINAEHERREAEQQTRKQKQAEQDRQRIIDALSQPETKTGIRDKAGINTARFGPVFAEMLKDGSVVTCEVTKGRRVFDGFRLNPDEPGREAGLSGCPGSVASVTDRTPIGSPSPVPIPMPSDTEDERDTE